jgi:hypothetical protein
MPQHGKGLGKVYKEAILKRIRHLRGDKEKRRRGEGGGKITSAV